MSSINKSNPGDIASAAFDVPHASIDGADASGFYRVEYRDAVGVLQWEDTIDNVWCLEGSEAVLTHALKGSSYTATCFLGLIESTGQHGVRRVPLGEALRGTSHHETVGFIDADPLPVLYAAKTQLGKPYDFLAIFGLWLRSGWDETDSWFCSELVAWALAQGGHSVFRVRDTPRVTQQHLWMLTPAR